MLLVAPRHFCIIQNPVVRDAKGNPIIGEDGSTELRHGDEEVRIEVPEPFPLYPGETLYGKVSPLQVVASNTALRLRAVRDFDKKKAGDEWLFKGVYSLLLRLEAFVFVALTLLRPWHLHPSC